MKNIRIISLGEIIRPNMMAGVMALSETTGISPQKIGAILQDVFTQRLINGFKLGKLPSLKFFYTGEEKAEYDILDQVLSVDAVEKIFCAQMVRRFHREENIAKPLTEEDFRRCWSVMNPGYEQYADLLQEAVAFNQSPDNELIILSFTNSLDVGDMKKNGVSVDPENPTSINGITLHASYHTHLFAQDMLQKIIKDICSSYSGPALFNQANHLENVTVTYVHTPAKEDVKKRFGTDSDEMLEICRAMNIQHLVWERDSHMSLSDALTMDPVPERKAGLGAAAGL